MREILFRGKRDGDGEWVMGDRAGYSDYVMIWDLIDKGVGYLVDPATVGQFTGLYDKNGKKIFEGDEVETSCGEIGIIEYLEEDGMFIISFPITSGHSSWITTFRNLDGNEMEVIGNVHDTPDLEKEEAE